jgi:hypothetical protein
VSKFWAGFALSTVLWAGVTAYLAFGLGYGPPADEVVRVAEAPVVEETPPEEEAAPRRRRRGRRARANAAPRAETPTGEATTGDDLGEGEMRTLDMGGTGGEQQLRPAQIEAGIDGAMGRIRRCLVLVEGDGEVRGRLVLGLRVGPDGRVRAVQLSGPRAVTTGEAGSCLSAAARNLQFDSFDGPEMVVRYPITLE